MRVLVPVLIAGLLTATPAMAYEPKPRDKTERAEGHSDGAVPPKTATATTTNTATTSEGFVPPVLIEAPTATYPPEALIAGVEGVVELRLSVAPSGTIDQATVVRGLGFGLDEAALAAVRSFVFTPARFGGKPVPCTVKYHFHFQLPVIPALPPVAEAHDESDHASEPASPVTTSSDETTATAEVRPKTYDVFVRGQRALTAASAMRVRDQDFKLRPHPRPADILQVTPGMYVAQHSGGGKANQYFLRGFDADHGTDVLLQVDGIPINNVSHGHGQGYADLHFIIPETVETIEVRKGPYFAQLGDFATAGAMNLKLRDELDENSVSFTGDRFNTLRGVVMLSPELDDWRPILAAELYHSDGPFTNEEDLVRFNVLTRLVRDLGPGDLSFTFMGYGAAWNASGQLPSREISAGRLDRFGFLDPNEGGNSHRYGVQAQYRDRTNDGGFSVMAYLTHYRLALRSNFTFFSRDPDAGDLIEQTDRRLVTGLDASYTFVNAVGDITFDTTFGAQVRNDSIENGLFYNRARERLTTVVDAQINEATLGLYAREDVRWTDWLRTELAVRGDLFGFDVTDRLQDAQGPGSGTRQAVILSPKANVVASVTDWADIFVNFGYGFHSNDARGVVRNADAVTPVTRARGYELGSRVQIFDRVDVAASFFVLDLDSETVWIGDEGTTEARGPSRRLGGELEVRAQIFDWLRYDADLTLTSARFTEAGADDAIPLAPRLTLQTGLSAQHKSGLYGRLGLFYLGSRPASEDRFIQAKGFARLDATAGYRQGWWEVSLAGQNLLDADIREAQFATTSRLANETSASDCPSGTRGVTENGAFSGCEDLNFSPGMPINVQGTISLYF